MPYEGSSAGGCRTRSFPTPAPAPVKRSAKSATPPQSGVAASLLGASSKVLLLVQMLVCVVGINLCFGWWSVKQERAITQPYFIAESTFATSMATIAAASHDARRAAALATAKLNAPPGKPHAIYLSTVYGISLTQTLAGAIVSAMLLGVNSLLQRFMRRRQLQPYLQGSLTANAPTAQDQHQHTELDRRDVLEMLAMGFSNIFGTSLGYAAMRRLSYPVALTAKMGKMLPVMLVGFLWYRTRYPATKVASCLLITGGVIAFFLLEERITSTANPPSVAAGGGSSSSTGPSTKGGKSSSSSSFLGMVLLLLNLFMDGFTNSTQDILVKRHRWSGMSLMMRTNLVSVLCALWLLFLLEFGEQPWHWLTSFSHCAVALAIRIPLMSDSALGRALGAWLGHTEAVLAAPATVPFHDLSHFLSFLAHCPEARHDVLLMSLLSALGQLFIFHTITVFGTLALTAMTLLRKGGSVILSIVVHGHAVQSVQWASLGAVFIGVLLEGYINIQEASRRQVQTAMKGIGAGSHEQHAQERGALYDVAATASSSSRKAAPVSVTPTPECASDPAEAAATALAGVQVLRSIAVPASPPLRAKKTQ
ncbi:UDP-galactose_transporter (plasmid) [Leishmania braziliensis MHOM/BR/75/M2904]|nr:UDP-galactose_transporter [Leishmania braziliensis MHOM/BR/75/M2904]